MTNPNPTWRAHPFRVGLEYEPCETFDGLTGGEFTAGRRYALKDVSYSYYDSATVFRFQAPGDSPIDWWWRDDEPEDLCAERYRLVSDADGA